MRFVFFTHSLVSDWNHGNAHFLRGVMRALVARGHARHRLGAARRLEPREPRARRRDRGATARFAADFPMLESRLYDPAGAPERAVAQADVVVVHEWTDPELVAAIGRAPARRRALPAALPRHPPPRDLGREGDRGPSTSPDYDGVLAFGETLSERLPRRRLGPAGLHLARGGRHAPVPAAPARSPPTATSSGSATGATASAPARSRRS